MTTRREPTKRTKPPSDAISYQVSVTGRGIDRLSHDAMRELVDGVVQGTIEPPAGVSVRVQCWRAGRELDLWDDNPRAQVLRDTFRRLLQAGRIALAVRAAEESD